MQKNIGQPSFVKIFKNESCAISALKILVSTKEAGGTNKKALEMQEFKNLFDDNYLNSNSPSQLEWRLKNMARDLKKMSFENLNPEFHEFKKYFESTRRKAI